MKSYSLNTWCGVVLWVLEVDVRALKQSERVILSRAFFLFFFAPYWRATKMAKHLSTASTPLCFGFFWCRFGVLQSWFSRSTISFAEFNVSATLAAYSVAVPLTPWPNRYFEAPQTSSYSLFHNKWTLPYPPLSSAEAPLGNSNKNTVMIEK